MRPCSQTDPRAPVLIGSASSGGVTNRMAARAHGSFIGMLAQ